MSDDTANAIVADLAACAEPVVRHTEGTGRYCVLCGAWTRGTYNVHHEPGCPWLRANDEE